MTPQQIEQVNRLQAKQNARFGDIAVKKGFLTQEQLDCLLAKQPMEHIILKQILGDKRYLSAQQVDVALYDFHKSLGVSDGQFALLMDNEVAAFVKHIAGIDESDILMHEFAKLFISLTLRLVEREIHIGKSYKSTLETIKYVTLQRTMGDSDHIFAFSSDCSVASKKFAEKYAKSTFSVLHYVAQDSLKEFINCVDGLVISELSNAGIMEIDIDVPEYYGEFSIDCDTTILPITLPFGEFGIFII
jgi:hypothetical protein